jgi:SAM-dependent methyltransferase
MSVDLRLCYNKTQIWHWAYLDYVGTDREVENSIENAKPSRNLEPRALDVGCGLQQIHRKTFERYGYKYFGIDINGSKPIINWDGSDFPIEDASMDYVLISWTMQNIENPHFVLEEVQRVLTKGGIVFIVNTILSPVSFPDGENAVLSKLEKIRLYPEGFRSALKEGFEDIKIESKGGIGQILGWKLHLIWWKFYRNRNPLLRKLFWGLFPVFILFTVITNIVGLIYNQIDSSGRFSSYFVLQARKQD